jgi:mRNA interferase MazF
MIECAPINLGMERDFDKWNEQKKEINERSAPFYHEREVWWCALGVNVGFEQDGSGRQHDRPVLVLKGLSAHTFIAIPLTTSTHEHPLRPSIGIVEGKEARALLSQMRVVDAKRLIRKIEYLEKGRFEDIRKAVRDML